VTLQDKQLTSQDILNFSQGPQLSA
jgi:hypothetical protein